MGIICGGGFNFFLGEDENWFYIMKGGKDLYVNF